MRKVVQQMISEIIVTSFRRGVIRFLKYEARKKIEDFKDYLESIKKQQEEEGGS